MVACGVLGEEMNTRANLSHFYGGGLEIVYLNKGKFEKLGNITYVFWAVNVIAQDKLEIAPQVAVHFSYSKDILLMHRIPLRTNLSANESVALFVVGPFHRNLDKTEIENLKTTILPDLNSGILCHYFAIDRPDAKPDNLVVIDTGQPDLVKFINEDNHISLLVYEKFAQRLMKSIRRGRTPV